MSEDTVYTVGIIGLGAMGEEMLGEMQRHPRFSVGCAWDPDAGCMSRVLSASAGVQAPADAEAVLGAAVDVVYLASPPATHAPYCLAVADAGRALFCEKPLGVALEPSREVVRHVAERGIVNAVNFNHAAAFDARTVQGWLEAGDLGAPRYVSMNLHLPRWPRPFQAHARWLAGREQGGFCREMLSHWLFLTRRLLGAGRVVMSRPRWPGDDSGSEIGLTAELDFQGVPVFVNAQVGGAGPVGMGYTLYGDESSVRLTSGGGLERWRDAAWVAVPPPADDPGDRARALDQLAVALAGEPSTVADVQEALAVQELVEALLRGT